jgi:hypothetical protein
LITVEAAILAVSHGKVAQLLRNLDYLGSACGIHPPSVRIVSSVGSRILIFTIPDPGSKNSKIREG